MHLPFLDKFPADAVILQKRGKGLSARMDKARFMEKKGTAYYETKKYGAKFKPSGFDDFITQNNGRPLIFIYEYQRDHFVPVNASNLQAIYEVKDGAIVKTSYTHSCFGCGNGTNPNTITVGGVRKKDVDVCEHCGSRDLTHLTTPAYDQPKISKFINLHATDEGMAFWGSVRRWKAEERHKIKSWWSENIHFIMYAMTWVLMVVLTYLFMSSISETGMMVSQALRQAISTPPG